jgi:Peptidase_C39 like family
MQLKYPKLDMLSVGILFVLLAGAGLLIFKVVIPKIMPASVILQVPFSAQAPTNNWSRNEDCEETSITMANAFVGGNTQDRLPAAATQNAINNLKAWENAHLGYNQNTGVDATTQMAEGAFNLKITQIPNFTEDDLKNALLNNHPILLPINAKLLQSAQYANGGPTYHMIVLRGFKGDTFIVNDPGTDNGDGNEYPFSILQKAAADWNNTTKTIDSSRKFALVVSK